MKKKAAVLSLFIIGGIFMAYTKIGWADNPSAKTPLSANNLNHMDEGIYQAHLELVSTVKKVNGVTPDKDGNVGIEIPNPDLSSYATKTEVETYVDNQISNIGNASPKGVFATLAALQSVYPNGDTGIYVVTADGKWYYWNESSWTAGGMYQSTGISDNSVTSPKRTNLGEAGIIGPNTQGKLINFDFTQNKIIVPEGATLLTRDRRYFLKASEVPLLSGGTSGLFLNSETNTLFMRQYKTPNETGWGTASPSVAENSILVALVYEQQKTVSCIGDNYAINGVRENSSVTNWGAIYNWSGAKINFDTVNKTLTFEKNIVVYHNNKRTILSENQVISTEGISGAFVITYSEESSSFSIKKLPYETKDFVIAYGNYDARAVFGISGDYMFDGEYVAESYSSMTSKADSSWEGWEEAFYRYGFAISKAKVPIMLDAPIEVRGTIIANASDYQRRWGLHVFEGWSANGTDRLTMLVDKHDDYAEIYHYYQPPDGVISNEKYKWVRIGSDVDNHGWDFNHDWAKAHTPITFTPKAEDPTVMPDGITPVPDGSMYYNSTLGKMRLKVGGVWKSIALED